MHAPPSPQNARSRPVMGGGLGKNTDRPWQAIDTPEDGEALRLRQAHRIGSWVHVSIPVAAVLADIHFRRAP